MRRLVIFIFFTVIICLVANSQFVVGLHGGYNSTWLINKQVFDQGAEQDIDISFGNFAGLIGSYYFSDNFGIEMNLNSNTIVQEYLGAIKNVLDDNILYTSIIRYKSTDIPLILKFGYETYFELGGMIHIVNKVVYNRIFTEPSGFALINGNIYTFSNATDVAVKNKFKSNGYGVLMGFGTHFNLINNKLLLNFGFRVNYILSDMEGINGLGFDKSSPYLKDDEKANFKTNPLYGGLKLGLVYVFD